MNIRIKTVDDLDKLGAYAKKQVQDALVQQGLNSGALSKAVHQKQKSAHSQPQPDSTSKKKKNKAARVMTTKDGRTYCPFPSPDPFVAVHKRLEAKYGKYENGGLLVTEMMISGGASDWRFDFALLSPINKVSLTDEHDTTSTLIGKLHVLIEADGFGFHRSKTAFKNDRKKQTHAITQHFVVMRITNEDARTRLDDIIADIDKLLSQRRIYESLYAVKAKGFTQSVFSWSAKHN